MTGVLMLACSPAAPDAGYNATKKVGPLSALQRLAIVLRQAGAETLAILTGRRPSDTERHLDEVGVDCRCFEASPAADVAGAWQMAAAHLRGRCSRVLLVRADTPLFSEDTVRTLLQNGAAPAVPLCGGAPGWPVLIPASSLDHLYPPAEWEDLPARLVKAGAAVPVADKGVLLRLDAEPAWEAVMEEYRVSQFRPVTKLMIAREDVFLGPGIYRLLCALRDAGSVRAACGKMGLSYSKGWRMIHNLEYQVGFEVVSRHKGGQDGGHSCLSPRGEQMLAVYCTYIEECEAAIRPIFERHFGHGPG